jgi:hypothetical protein
LIDLSRIQPLEVKASAERGPASLSRTGYPWVSTFIHLRASNRDDEERERRSAHHRKKTLRD